MQIKKGDRTKPNQNKKFSKMEKSQGVATNEHVSSRIEVAASERDATQCISFMLFRIEAWHY